MNFKNISLKGKIVIAVLAGFLLLKIAGPWFFPGKNSLEVVRSSRVERGDLVIKISATGDVKPQNRVEIKPPIAGRVEEVLVKEGQAVKQGDLLALMSSIERAALLDAARSQSPEVFKKWQEAYKAAPLVAPLDGTVIVRSVEPGQTVTTADPVVVLSDRLIVKALVDETDLSFIRLGQKVEVHLDAYPDNVIEAKVDHISFESTLVNNVNVYEVDILPVEMPDVFRSGMTANVTFFAEEKKGVLLVPSEAVTAWPKDVKQEGGAEFAVYYKGLGGRLSPVPVEIGTSDGRMTEIVKGLQEGVTVQIVRRKQEAAGVNPFMPGRGRRPNQGQGQGRQA